MVKSRASGREIIIEQDRLNHKNTRTWSSLVRKLKIAMKNIE